MKNSLKITAIVLGLAGFTLGAKAQTNPSAKTTTSGIRYSIGVDAGIPTGKLSDSYNWNLGGSLQVDIPVASQLFVTVNAGYNNFFGKDLTVAGVTVKQPNIQLLPAKAGLKFFPVNNFYVQGEAGAAFVLNKKDFGADKSAAFIYAPQIGYQFPLSGGSYLDAGVRYEASTKLNSAIDDSKVNFVGLRLAYGF
ncbi:porin family protein [Mucilaginibacter sp. UR6-11]|uniref:porin family protein n=1 Tax=Mucilaginibacter sp. UR6-11 TaxID=1435644 RepID=UPI001E57A657|nr:porin family protein [Mucilaginibacter sp. UR6-11]MCC8424821.1 porin family protein [Mucilaginibacter sp. UR6-11]